MNHLKKALALIIACSVFFSSSANKYIGNTGIEGLSLEINTLKKSKYLEIIGDFKPYWGDRSDESIQKHLDSFTELLENSTLSQVAITNSTNKIIRLNENYLRGLSENTIEKEKILELYKPLIKSQKNLRNGGIAMAIAGPIFASGFGIFTLLSLIYTLFSCDPIGWCGSIAFGLTTAMSTHMSVTGIRWTKISKNNIKKALENELKVKNYSHIQDSYGEIRDSKNHLGQIILAPGETFVDVLFLNKGAESALEDGLFSLAF